MRPSAATEDTIVARATAPGQAAVGVVRVSGSRAKEIVVAALGGRDTQLEPRRARLGTFRDAGGEEVDQVLTTWYPAPHSYTGEEVVEISSHGSPFICREIVQACIDRGARPAEPGEFTRRAFVNGKLDLVQAEAVRDLVASQTRFQAILAREQLEGALSRELQPVRDEIVDVLAHLETTLEFVEEEVEPEARGTLVERIGRVDAALERMVRSYEGTRTVREGARVVLAGRPNVGKSSIFNRLLHSERAIVTTLPGTTRDALREWLDLGGLPVCLVDTAGLREAIDQVEEAGIERSREQVREADLILFVVDADEGFGSAEIVLVEELGAVPFLLVINKIDLATAPRVPAEVRERAAGVVEVSAKTGSKVDELTELIKGAILGAQGPEREGAAVTNARQLRCIGQAREALRAGSKAVEEGLSEEFACYDLRRSLEALGELTGETSTDDILGRIFSTFCIGK